MQRTMHYASTDEIEGQTDATHNQHRQRVFDGFNVDKPLYRL